MSKLEQLRKNKGISQKVLAETLGVDQSTGSLWESGKTFPRPDVAIRLACALDCTIEDIYRTREPSGVHAL